MKRKKLRLGDIYEIPLPNGKFAYARLFKEYTLAFYDGEYIDKSVGPEKEKYKFFIGVYKDLLQDGEWKVVGNRPFSSEEEAWPPKLCIVDKLSGKYSIYYRGEITPSNKEACKNLEHAAAWDREHVIGRLMGNEQWTLIG